MKFVFFKRPTPKQFNYRPRYWDPEQEEFDRRKRLLDGDPAERSAEEIKRDIRMQMDSRWRRRHDTGNAGRANPWMRLFIYALIIFFALYFIFFTGFINNLVRFFTE